MSKYIPDAYTIIEDAFIGKTISSNRFKTITVEEYSRPDWTYHAKGKLPPPTANRQGCG